MTSLGGGGVGPDERAAGAATEEDDRDEALDEDEAALCGVVLMNAAADAAADAGLITLAFPSILLSSLLNCFTCSNSLSNFSRRSCSRHAC